MLRMVAAKSLLGIGRVELNNNLYNMKKPAMTMKSIILGLLAETAIHPGAGQSSGVIDLPVAREVTTDYPVIPGSSLKGALADFARASGLDKTDYDRIFGKTDNAGELLISDARLLLLPVRSLSSVYKWVTCPHLIERWQRDAKRAEINNAMSFRIPTEVNKGHFLGENAGDLFLEEFQFKSADNSAENYIQKLAKSLGPLITHEATRKRLDKQLVVLHDDDFAWFARNGLGVQARNVLDKETKTSQNLWYEEIIPTDSLFCTMLAERGANVLEPIQKLLTGRPYLQVGGNETVGMGWFAVALPPKQEGGIS
jgi:CRISPR-associated protein Cmr4